MSETSNIIFLLASADLLSPDFDFERDDMTLLNEILNMSSAGGDDFSQQWQSSFGTTPMVPSQGGLMSSPTSESEPAQFLPSHLLDLGQLQMGQGQFIMLNT